MTGSFRPLRPVTPGSGSPLECGSRFVRGSGLGWVLGAGVAFSCLVTSTLATATELKLVPESSEVIYAIDHTLGPVKSTAGTPSGSLDVGNLGESPQVTSGQITVDLRALKTGVDQRDRHIHSEEYLHVERFPSAQFVLANFESGGAVTVPGPPGTSQGTARGTLQLHGVSREIVVPVMLLQENGKLRVRGNFVLSLAEYDIKRPKKMMFSAGKTVEVHVDLLFSP